MRQPKHCFTVKSPFCFSLKHVGVVGHYTSPEAEQQSQDLIYSDYDLFSFAQVNAIRHPHVQKYFSKRLMAIFPVLIAFFQNILHLHCLRGNY